MEHSRRQPMEVCVFGAVTCRDLPPVIDAVLSEFFSGCVRNERFGVFPTFEADGPQLGLCKNIYNLPDVFATATELIVTDEVRTALEPLARVRFRPCRIEHAFSFPYAAGDQSYLRNPCYPGDSADLQTVVDAFGDKYAVPVPPVRLWEVVPMLNRALPTMPRDIVTVRVCDPPSGIQTHRVRISPTALAEYKLMWSAAFFCLPHVFEVIRPHLRLPFMWYTSVTL